MPRGEVHTELPTVIIDPEIAAAEPAAREAASRFMVLAAAQPEYISTTIRYLQNGMPIPPHYDAHVTAIRNILRLSRDGRDLSYDTVTSQYMKRDRNYQQELRAAREIGPGRTGSHDAWKHLALTGLDLFAQYCKLLREQPRNRT